MTLLMLIVPQVAHAQCATTLSRDLNCNGVDAADELPVDISDPVCAANVDGSGNPFPNRDFYYDYGTFGCEILIFPDDDNDGFG
ncbi:MAG: hypothetical protein AAF602_13335, partial [Myxococcota bacterium]